MFKAMLVLITVIISISMVVLLPKYSPRNGNFDNLAKVMTVIGR